MTTPSSTPPPPTVSTVPPPARTDVPRTGVSLHRYVDSVFHREELPGARFRHHARRALVAVALLTVLFGAVVFAFHRLSRRFACRDRHGVYVDGVCLAPAATIELP